MAIKQIEMTVATTDVIAKYSGQWRINEQMLRQLAEQLRKHDRPMHIEHDARRTMATRVVDADVRQRADGEWELWALVEADESEWAKAGDRTGISVAVLANVYRPERNPALPDIRIAIEPSAFGDDFRKGLTETLRPFQGKANVTVDALFQFNVDAEVVKIVIEIALFSLMAIGEGAIYDLVKTFWPLGKRRTNHIEFVVDRTETAEGVRDSMRLIVETDDSEVAMKALQTAYEGASTLTGTIAFDVSSGSLKQVSPGDESESDD